MYIKSMYGILCTLSKHLLKYPSPINLSYLWNYGFISFIYLCLQLITGVFLAMSYCSDIMLAFSSVEHVMRDIFYGWLLRYSHSNGASFFFIIVYMHIARGLYYSRFSYLNTGVWVTGLLIFFLMMGSAFIGYVLPWGQMSFWGATVITSLVSAAPAIGGSVVLWLWGGFSVDTPTLARFFSLHFVLPGILLGTTFAHFYFLHNKGSSNPSVISPQINRGYLPLYPYFIIKDWVGFSAFIYLYLYFVFFLPNYLGHSDNYIEANPMSTPAHIVPEWYFLPFYAILRSISDKALGVLAMLYSILYFFLFPLFSYIFYLLGFFWVGSFSWSIFTGPTSWWYFFNIFSLLGWVGSKPVEEPYSTIGFFLLIAFFLAVMLNSGLLKAAHFNFLHYSRFGLTLESYIINFNLVNIKYLTRIELDSWFYYIVSIFTLIFALLLISLILSNSFMSKKGTLVRSNSYECGFMPVNSDTWKRVYFPYFRVALLFLIFDLEILYTVPWLLISKFFFLSNFFFLFYKFIPILFFIFIGIIYEYVTGSLDWVV